MVYVDECGIDTYLYRKYEYAPREQQVFGRISGRKYNAVALLLLKWITKFLPRYSTAEPWTATFSSSGFSINFCHLWTKAA